MVDLGQEEQHGFLRSLRRGRAAAFRKEIVPHFRYVFQSGFGLFASAIFFTVLVWYVDFIKAVPVNWPAGWVGVAVIALASIRAPLRTYFRPADPIFLLAMEGRLLEIYIRPALHNAIVMGVIRVLVVCAIYTPIYNRAPITADIASSHPFVVMAILFAIVSGYNVYGGWRERRLAAKSWRVMLKMARILLTVLIVAGLMLKPLSLAVPFMLLCMVVMWVLWRLPIQHALPWEKLIEDEEATRRRWMSFLGWFVDVPTEASKPARRRWIAWVGDYLLWKHQWSWHFLYAKVFLRGETFGAFWRWVLLAAAILVVSGNVVVDAVIYGIAFLICGLQLSELRRVRFVETAATLPIAPEGRLVAAAAIARTAGLGAALLLGLIGILTAGIGATGTGTENIGSAGAGMFRLDIWLPMIVVGLLWCGWWVPRKIARFLDEDDL
ncbi:ABC transporter permease [Cohnella abietis]|uniref:ABC transporter permease n=1 Tax=Cohnella abietis TaxID=2507935 RepID=A0A3T1DAA9_9BACL|nr:ABC transporter permease [Cohnella abietis]BBI35042.1 hypothetical protein KCTCHS21_44410 [Cohnella abietis]